MRGVWLGCVDCLSPANAQMQTHLLSKVTLQLTPCIRKGWEALAEVFYFEEGRFWTAMPRPSVTSRC